MDNQWSGVCTIHPSPGGSPRGRPALNVPGTGPRIAPVTTPAPTDETLICSARGCGVPAVWALRWNNPRLHAAERRKTWLACADHRESLSAFLDARGFLREVVAVPQSPTLEP
ncbi:hypothetical protein GA0070604_4397 [Micromonospora eburnea]|uniref:Acetone carboxylase n=1 Tax=Micromonospora eburnea TaxID=227316 RepID=A0A1C6V450_9ACTN|nr:hypothetical protein GA0070604_4397 [Micromonospora eburnea]